MLNSYIDIDNVQIDSDLVETNFTCDLTKCKGACCTMESEFGAPLEKDEISKIQKNLTKIKKYLPLKHVSHIKEIGFWETKQNRIMTTSINNRECVFVFYDTGTAKCGIEKAFHNGDSDFRKPISCHLFPIRVMNFGGIVLKFEEYSECRHAVEKGSITQISTFDFCKDALQRLLGKKWFESVKDIIRSNKCLH